MPKEDKLGPVAVPARPAAWEQTGRISLRGDLHVQPHQVLPPTSSTRADFLCKIEQLNGLNKSDDKTLIAIFLPPSLKRAICRHLERYFIKQERKQFRKFPVNLPSELWHGRSTSGQETPQPVQLWDLAAPFLWGTEVGSPPVPWMASSLPRSPRETSEPLTPDSDPENPTIRPQRAGEIPLSLPGVPEPASLSSCMHSYIHSFIHSLVHLRMLQMSTE
jgi:hypothetical protein